MIPVLAMSFIAAIILGLLTEIRENSHHTETEKEAWINVGINMVNAWKTTMLFTGSDNLARDQLFSQVSGKIMALNLKRNPKMFQINPESSPYMSTDLELEVLNQGKPISHISEEESDRMLFTLIPIIAESKCVDCHLKLNKHDFAEGEVMAVVTLITSLKNVDALISSDRNGVFIGLIVAILFSVAFIFISMKRITNPIKILTNAAKKVTSGVIDTQVDITSDDEIGVLARTFNEMTSELKSTKDELQKYTEHLEEEVKLKTKEVQESEAALKRLMKGTAKSTGKQFFENLILTVTEMMECRWGILGEIIDDKSINTLAWCEDKRIKKSIDFPLQGTPFEDLEDSSFRAITKVREQYPDDKLLKKFGVESYFGLPFSGSNGKAIGVLNILHDKDLKPPKYVEEIVSVFAERAAAELERLRAEEAKERLSEKLKLAERERARAALREGEQRYRTLVESISEWVWEVDDKGSFTYSSPMIKKLLGYEPYEVIGKAPFDFMQQEDAERFKKKFHDLLSSDKPFKGLEYINYNKNGERLIFEMTGNPVFDATGNLQGYRGITRDITERVKNEEQIRQLSSAVEQSPSSVVITDTDGKIIYVNPKFCRVSGYTAEEVINKNPRILNSGIQTKMFYKELWDTIIEGKEWSGEFQNRKKNGQIYWESALISPIKNSTGEITHFLAVKEDITEKKRTQASLEQSSKLAAIGELAAGVAHEINNPLTNIIGYSRILSREIGSDSRYAEYLEGINEDAQRAHKIIGNLLSFAREAPLDVQPSNINELLDKVINQIDKVKSPPDITLKNHYQENLPEIYIDQNQIQQVFINLINNAFHSMPDGGELFITTSLDKEGDLLNIEFKDTGIGIEEEKLGKVFNPFFTTKDVGKGTGLGLSISYGIIKAHEGSISLESEVGKGTLFTVSLPITNGLEKS